MNFDNVTKFLNNPLGSVAIIAMALLLMLNFDRRLTMVEVQQDKTSTMQNDVSVTLAEVRVQLKNVEELLKELRKEKAR